MKAFDFDGMDREIHWRLYGRETECPRYSREVEAARRIVELLNLSGRYQVSVKRVVGEDGDGESDWQCEIYTADGLDNLATEIDEFEGLAICRAVSGADVRLIS